MPIMANDIYSLGATVFEVLAGYLPFGNDGGLLQKKGAEIPEIPGDFSQQLKQVLDSCLNDEPWSRPTAAQLHDIAVEALRPSPTTPPAVSTPSQKLSEGRETMTLGAIHKEQEPTSHVNEILKSQPIQEDGLTLTILLISGLGLAIGIILALII